MNDAMNDEAVKNPPAGDPSGADRPGDNPAAKGMAQVVDLDGLTETEAQARLAQYGGNACLVVRRRRAGNQNSSRKRMRNLRPLILLLDRRENACLAIWRSSAT